MEKCSHGKHPVRYKACFEKFVIAPTAGSKPSGKPTNTTAPAHRPDAPESMSDKPGTKRTRRDRRESPPDSESGKRQKPADEEQPSTAEWTSECAIYCNLRRLDTRTLDI